MADPALSQDEMDALLERAGATPEGAAEAPAGDGAALPDATTAAHPAAMDAALPAGGTVRRYDLSAEGRLVRGRLPAIDAINERFARNLRDGVRGFMRRDPDVSATAARVQKFSAFLEPIAEPASLNVVQLRPLRGHALVAMDAQLAFTIVDHLFGGGAPARPDAPAMPARPAREFSATEQRICARLLDVVLAEYVKSWTGIQALQPHKVRTESHKRFADIALPADMVVAQSFHMEFAGAGGALHIAIPWSGLEPIRDLLYTAPQGDADASDQRWVALLTQQIKSATVELATELAYSQATVRELLTLKAGDFIELDRAPTLVAKVDGVPVFECDYGTLGSRYGVRIREFLTQPAAAIPGAAAGRP